jgi:carboxylesterase type B
LHPTTPLPVYIYIHGGVFTIGASEQSVFDGTAMSYNHGQKNVVVVTINYRLHALGFMALHALQTQALNDLDQPLWYQEDGSISTNQTSTPVYTNGN